jgi:hypothetical protein
MARATSGRSSTTKILAIDNLLQDRLFQASRRQHTAAPRPRRPKTRELDN